MSMNMSMTRNLIEQCYEDPAFCSEINTAPEDPEKLLSIISGYGYSIDDLDEQMLSEALQEAEEPNLCFASNIPTDINPTKATLAEKLARSANQSQYFQGALIGEEGLKTLRRLLNFSKKVL